MEIKLTEEDDDIIKKAFELTNRILLEMWKKDYTKLEYINNFVISEDDLVIANDVFYRLMKRKKCEIK